MSQVFISAYKHFSLFSLAFVVVEKRKKNNNTASKRDIWNFRVMAVRDIDDFTVAEDILVVGPTWQNLQ